MAEVLWFVFPFVVALGSGVLSFIVAHARMEVTTARQREELVEARASIAHHHKATEEKIKAAEAEARRKALDEFLADVKVEERHYVRRFKRLGLEQKTLVLQERICFRNIPLCQWIERELPVEETAASLPEADSGTAYLAKSSIRAAIASRNAP